MLDTQIMQSRLIAYYRSFAGLMLLAVVALSGCTANEPEPNKVVSSTNLGILYRAYIEYSNEKQVPPDNESDLEPYIEQDLFDSVFVSPRDNKPYKIYWGTQLDFSRHSNTQVIAHEQDGSNGTRCLITAHGLSQMTDQQFEAAGLPKN